MKLRTCTTGTAESPPYPTKRWKIIDGTYNCDRMGGEKGVHRGGMN